MSETRKLRQRAALALPALALFALSCGRVQSPQAPAPSNGRADFTRYVAVGNSICSGYQSGGLLDTYQDRAYPILISAQAGRASMRHPRISGPGLPGLLHLDFSHPIPNVLPFSIETFPGQGVLENPDDSLYENLGIPGAKMGDFFAVRSGEYFDAVLRGRRGGTIWSQLKAQRPTFVTFWLGANDALGALLYGTPDSLTGFPEFSIECGNALDSLQSLQAGLAVANIPDVTDIPFANTVPPYLFDPLTGAPALLNGHRIPFIGPRDGTGTGSLDPGSVVTLLAIPYIGDGYGISRLFGGNGLPLPDDVVLTPKELRAIQFHVEEFNRILAQQCARRGIPLVNMNVLQHRLHVEGFNLGGVQFSSRFLFGGLYSLDGIHPSDLGQALVANEWIRVINDSYGASISSVPLSRYVHTGSDGSAPGLDSPAAGVIPALSGVHLEHLRKDLDP